MQIGTFIHRVLELTHATLLAEALGCDVAEVDSVVESALLQDIAGSRITSDNLEHAKQVLDSCFAQVWDEQFNNINRASSMSLFRIAFKKENRLRIYEKISRIFSSLSFAFYWLSTQIL